MTTKARIIEEVREGARVKYIAATKVWRGFVLYRRILVTAVPWYRDGMSLDEVSRLADRNWFGLMPTHV